jgi:hypothetical protein
MMLDAFSVIVLHIYKTHGSLIFWSNPLAKLDDIAEYPLLSREQTGLCVGFIRN